MSNDHGRTAEESGSQKGLGTFPNKNVNEVILELQSQTDRGVAVLGGAFMEASMRGTLKVYFRVWDLPNANPKHKPLKMGAKLLGDDDTGGELGFVDQCRLAYCLNIIGGTAYRDLERVAQIRNKFAHHTEIRSFTENEKIVRWCNELESTQRAIGLMGSPTWDFGVPSEKLTSRQKFLQAVHAIWVLLAARSLRFADKTEAEPDLRDTFSW